MVATEKKLEDPQSQQYSSSGRTMGSMTKKRRTVAQLDYKSKLESKIFTVLYLQLTISVAVWCRMIKWVSE